MSHNAGIGIRILGLIVLGNILPIGNVQAGWFGLTEDHPYKNMGPYRTTFVTANVNTCVKLSKRDITAL